MKHCIHNVLTILAVILLAFLLFIASRDTEPLRAENKQFAAIKIEQKEKTVTDTTETIVKVSKEEQFSNTDLLINIAKCESNLNSKAKNKMSSARGLYQILDIHGLTKEQREDPEESTKWAIKEIRKNGTKAWNSSKSCWNH
jgi:Transglycosylase SLT domain